MHEALIAHLVADIHTQERVIENLSWGLVLKHGILHMCILTSIHERVILCIHTLHTYAREDHAFYTYIITSYKALLIDTHFQLSKKLVNLINKQSINQTNK